MHACRLLPRVRKAMLRRARVSSPLLTRVPPLAACADANYDAVPDAGWSKTLTMVLSLPKLKKGPGGHGRGTELM